MMVVILNLLRYELGIAALHVSVDVRKPPTDRCRLPANYSIVLMVVQVM